MIEGTFAQCTHKYLNVYAQSTHKFLMRMLSARVSSSCVCLAHASVPDADAQRTHQGHGIRTSVHIFSIIFKIPKKEKN
jgi:hypothetical protein